MCPDAIARTAKPMSEHDAPSVMDAQLGTANQKYAPANANPRGTRNRVAILDQDQLATRHDLLNL
jgi:hypothetical protein